MSFLYKTYAGKENVEAITKAGFKVNVLNLFSIGNEYQVNTSLAVNNSRQLATINVTGGTNAMLETFDLYRSNLDLALLRTGRERSMPIMPGLSTWNCPD